MCPVIDFSMIHLPCSFCRIAGISLFGVALTIDEDGASRRGRLIESVASTPEDCFSTDDVLRFSKETLGIFRSVVQQEVPEVDQQYLEV